MSPRLHNCMVVKRFVFVKFLRTGLKIKLFLFRSTGNGTEERTGAPPQLQHDGHPVGRTRNAKRPSDGKQFEFRLMILHAQGVCSEGLQGVLHGRTHAANGPVEVSKRRQQQADDNQRFDAAHYIHHQGTSFHFGRTGSPERPRAREDATR